MNACMDSQALVAIPEIDEAICVLSTPVEDLLRRLSGSDPVPSRQVGVELGLAVPVHFPDGIGTGETVARLFHWQSSVRLDVQIVHDRMFAKPDGSPSDRRCFLNDYQASISLPPGSMELPAGFIREVVSGVAAARNAVQRHNRRHLQPWNRVVVAAQTQKTPLSS